MREIELAPGERLAWTSKCGTWTVVLQRTDAGQTYTVETLVRGRQDDLEPFTALEPACRLARYLAEMFRDLSAMEAAA